MSLQDFIVESINRSAVQVFGTMLSAELAPGVLALETSTPDLEGGVVSFIGLAGSWAGTGSVSCSAQLACRICSVMLMMDSTSVDEDVLDAVAEVTNMIIGNVKTDLETQLGPLGLSIPTVVFGRNFKTRTIGTIDWIVLRFDWDGDPLVVKFCLAPQENAQRLGKPVLGHACALDV